MEAENLFLRRQLALYRERGVKPKRIDAATRVTLTLLSRWFYWRSALVVVLPETQIDWHRAGFRLWWRWKSRPGRPPIPKQLREAPLEIKYLCRMRGIEVVQLTEAHASEQGLYISRAKGSNDNIVKWLRLRAAWDAGLAVPQPSVRQ